MKTKRSTNKTTSEEHKMKYQTAYNKELMEVPLSDIAKLALSIMQGDQAATQCEATCRAYELLELAAAGQRTLAYDYSWQNGIETLENLKKLKEKAASNPIPDISKRDENGRGVPVPFNDLLEALMPDQRKVKHNDRMPIVRRWIVDYFKCDITKAGNIIAEWKNSGVPYNLFQIIRWSWVDWKKNSLSETRKISGAKGRAQPKKGKQGTVRSRRTDKRLGAKNKSLMEAISEKTP